MPARRRRPSKPSPLSPRAPQGGASAPAELARQAGGPSLWLWAGAIVLLGVLAYWNSLNGAFFLDDQTSITENPDIRQVWSLDILRSASGESAVLGRPLVTLSFAINYAIGGLNPAGYHVTNIAIHILCALVMFGLIRRVQHSAAFAFACASLWMLHPLNTEALDYLSQRTELMMGLFYLLTIYASIRAHTSTRPAPWLAAAVVSSMLGAASKQSMVTVPAAVVLVDRVFFFHSLPEAFRRRWRFYLVLAASWLVVVATVLVSPRAHSVGFSSGVDAWTYLLNQSLMITRYLALTVWPRGLVVVYGFARPLGLLDVLPQFLLIATLFALTVAALRYRPQLGFLGAWFFLTLGVTSSVVPIATEAGAERRMYLPLAALVVLGVSLIAWLTQQITRTGFARTSPAVAPRAAAAIVCACVWAAVAGVFAAGTVARNREYSSALELARTSVDRSPNGHGRHVLATELLKAGRHDEAVAMLREAIRDDSRSHYTLGVTLFQDGKFAEAREQLSEFVRLDPLLLEAVNARSLIGRTLVADGQLDRAAEQFSLAQAMQPAFPDAHLGLGEVRFAQQRYPDAIVQYEAYLKTNPTDDGAWINLGVSYLRTGQQDAAIAAFGRAAAVNPRSGSAQRNLAATLLQKGDIDAAVRHAREAVALRPSDPLSHDLLGMSLLANRTPADAIAEFQQALRLNPADAEVQAHLQQAFALQGPGRRR